MSEVQLNELAAALSKAQGEIENATKNAKNPFFNSKYADLAECLNAVRPVFSKHGLSIVQMPEFENGIASVKTLLLHSSGQNIESTLSAPIGGRKDVQAIGACITYLRRYSLSAFAGIAQEDDDGNSQRSQKKQAKPDKHFDELIKFWNSIHECLEMGDYQAAYEFYNSIESQEDKVLVWGKFNAKDRATMKTEFETLRLAK